jgi:hypothetical protein
MFNPKTGTLLNENSSNYANLIKEGFIKEKINNMWMMIPPDKKKYIKLPTHYIDIERYHKNRNTSVIFPNTGKSIKYETAKKKLDFYIEYDEVDPIKIRLIPNDKSVYEKHEDNYWIKKGSTAYIQAEKDNKILKKLVYAPNKRLIPIESKQYEQLLDEGFVYDDKINSLIYPLNLHEAEITCPCGASDLKFLTENNINKISLRLDDDTILEIPNESLTKIAVIINKALAYTATKIGVIIGIEGGNEVKFGIAFQGESNCVITALDAHMKNSNYDCKAILDKLYEKFKDGVYGSEDYNYICKKLKLRIKVNYPPYNRDDYVKFGKESNKQRSMFECNYQNHHVKIIKERINKPVIYHDFLNWQKLSLDTTKISNIIGKIDDPILVETDDTIYKAKYVSFNGSDLELDGTMSSTDYYTKVFIKKNPKLVPIFRKSFNIDAIKTICQHGITFSKKIDTIPHKDLINYDIKSAYTTYDKCEYYSGFPTDLEYSINVEDYDLDQIKEIINKYEGFAMIKMTCLWSKKEVDRWVSFPYVKHYMENRADKITFYYMMISTDKVDDVDKSELDTTKRLWHYVLGSINKTTRKASFCTIDPLLAKTTPGCIEEAFITNTKLYRKTNTISYINKSYYPHIAGYVQNYTEIRLEQFVLKHDIKNIYRVWIDGIYTDKDITCSTDWHKETISTQQTDIYDEDDEDSTNFKYVEFSDVCNITYKVEIPKYSAFKFEERLPCGNVIVRGCAGTGKTYLLKNLYNQIPNSIVLVPTNELIKQFPSCKCITIDNFMYHPKTFNNYSTLLIDEYSMISQETIDKALENINVNRIILFGDLNQLGLIQGTAIDETQYKILGLERNYRQHNEKFQKKLNQMRIDGKFKFKQQIDPKEALNRKFLILSSTHKDIDKLNAMGLVLNDNKLINGLKIGAPTRFYKTCKSYNAGEMGTITDINDTCITIKKTNGVEVVIKKSTFDTQHKLAYSVTYHAIQGKTIHNQSIAINTNKLFDKNMKYVGCSRVIDETQLYLLVGL